MLIRQKRLELESGDSFEIIPLYDNADSPIGIIYGKINDDSFTPRQYWFLKNLQGDVLSLLDEDGVEVVRYTYNDWGQVTIAHDVSGVLLGHKNPFRWRGYEYEEDTTLYYLVTRYYDSKTGRFLNEDDHAFLGASGNTVSYNLYTYCENDPVNNVDPMGRMALSATLGGALPSIMAGIGASIAGIKTAIATSWLVPVCIAATAVAMIGIIHVVNKAKVLMISASQAISAVQNMIKEYSNNKLKPHGYTVYVIVREKTTDVVYVGITNNFSRRKSEHTNPGKRFSGKFKMFAIATGLTKLEARIMEQTIITAYTLDTLQNMINSISPKKWSNFNKEFNQLKTLMESWVDPN